MDRKLWYNPLMKKGFTLIEIVIATAIMVLTLAAFVGTFVMAKRTSSIADYRQEALNYSRQFLETLLMTNNYATLSAGITANAQRYTSAVSTSVTYKISYEVATNSSPPWKTIRVWTDWTNIMCGNITSRVELTTLISSELHRD